jgi:hypothetical protein
LEAWPEVSSDGDEDEDEREEEKEEEAEEAAEENDPSWLVIGALFEKLNSLEENPISGLSDGRFGVVSRSYN